MLDQQLEPAEHSQHMHLPPLHVQHLMFWFCSVHSSGHQGLAVLRNVQQLDSWANAVEAPNSARAPVRATARAAPDNERRNHLRLTGTIPSVMPAVTCRRDPALGALPCQGASALGSGTLQSSGSVSTTRYGA